MEQPNRDTQESLPFEFTGTALQFFGIWIVNILLIIITLGIYFPWAKVRTQRYFHSNTLLQDAPFDYLADPLAILKGWAVALVVVIAYQALTGLFPVTAALLLPLILLATPWIVVRSMRFRMRNTAWQNIRFGFSNAYRDAIKVFVGWLFLAILTLGLLYPRFIYEVNRFIVNNSGYGTTRFQFHAQARDFYKIYLKASLILLAPVVLMVALAYPQIKQGLDLVNQLQQVEAEQAQQEQDELQQEVEELQQEQPVMEESHPSVDPVEGEPALEESLLEESPATEMTEEDFTALEEAVEAGIADETGVAPETAAPEVATTEVVEPEAIVIPESVSGESPLEATATPEALLAEPVVEPEAMTVPSEELPPQEAEEEEQAAGTTFMQMLGVALGALFGLFVLFYLVLQVYIGARITNLVYNSTEIAGHRFRSSIRARDLAWLYFSNLVAIGLSFGLLIPWTRIRLARYRASKLQLLPSGSLDDFMQAEADKVNAIGDEIGEAFDIDFAL